MFSEIAILFGLRPKPMYVVGNLYLISKNLRLEYLLIKNRRYLRPNGRKRKEWVYDGIVLRAEKERRIEVFTCTTCIGEKDLVALPIA